MAMAGRQPEQGEGSREADSVGGLDHFLRRLDSSDAAEVGAGPGATVSQQQPQTSPSNSIAALMSNYDSLSPNPANPWQYLSISNPASPTSQREHYNHLSGHTSSGGQFQRDQLTTEWNMLEELEQQRAVSQSQTAVVSRAPTMNHQHLQPVPRRGNRPDGTSGQNGAEQSEANFMYEEAAAAAAWYRDGGFLRGSDAALQPLLYEGLARLDSQASDSAQLASEARMRSWERAMTNQYFAAGEMVQDQLWPSRTQPSAGGAQAGGSTRSTNSIRTPSNTSQSSGSDGEDSDEEEYARIGSASGDGNSSGKRKTPEPSGEDGNDSARTSSEAELKKPVASLPRRRSSSKKPREPRYAIKTRTDVDIMDDGFKWRKYGQKAVKNSPHPRNYYRCTTPQCPVRKRVERSHEDSGLVITTYEGMHTHQTPGFRGPAPQFGECPPRNLLFNPGPLGPAGFVPRFPFPPEYPLAALHQLRALQQAARAWAAQHQIPPGPPFPNAQRESIRRAQQFLGLHDPTFGAVKQEPLHDFMAQLRGRPNLPFLGRNFQPPPGGASFLDAMRQRQQMQCPAPPPPPPPPRHLPPMPDLDYPDFSPDLVRRVLEAEDGDHGPSTDANADSDGSPGQSFASQIQSSLRSRVEVERRMSLQQSSTSQPSGSDLLRRRCSSDTRASTSSQRRQPHHARDDDSLVDGLLQEMAQPNASS